jgi:hypothetical protein
MTELLKKEDFPWTKHEDSIVQEFREYLKGTYGEHYSTDDGIQAVDIWESLGSLETTSRDNAIKYLIRFGKKGGKSRLDLLKAMHYIVLMIYTLDKEKKPEFKEINFTFESK